LKPDQQNASSDTPRPAGAALGTFSGVFTPSILTILGLILFLRLGPVVGAAGLPRALLIILLANAISILTSISLSAIATNLRVKGGGDYYLISRTLGVEYGAALGLVLFLAQAVSIGFYAIGFGEALANISGSSDAVFVQAVAAAAVLTLFAVAWLGANWATRFQFVIMGVLFVAIAGFFVGGFGAWDAELLRGNLEPSSDHGLWIIFAVFFPAVTGFTQGVSMSGDLKDPGRSLPRGTFLAVGVSLVIYVAAAVLFAGTVPGGTLVGDSGAMRRVAPSPLLVDAGVIAATLSSGLASFLGAPRILQSLAGDRVFSFLEPFAVGHGPSANPRRGVLLALVIAAATVAIGNLDRVAMVVTMFFLISYGLLNYATYVEARASSPSFRPRFRFFNERLSLLGALACLGAMLAIQPMAAIVAVALLFAVHQYVANNRRSIDRWADSGRSRSFQHMRESLHAMSRALDHPRYWRPVILAFESDRERRERLLRFASWLEGRSGLTTAVLILRGEGTPARRLRDSAEKELRGEVAAEPTAFPRVVVAPDVEDALPVLLQSYGLGPVRANTVLLDWEGLTHAEKTGVPGDGASRSRLALRYGCNLVLLAAASGDLERVEETRARERRIDVWHRDNATGRLMLLLAYLMTRTETWKDASIRVVSPADPDVGAEATRHEIERLLREGRIPAEAIVVDACDEATLVGRSGEASMIFLPLRISDGIASLAMGEMPIDELVSKLPAAALVLAAEDISLDPEPEEGEHGEIARAVDQSQDAARAAKAAEKKAAEAETRAKKAREELVEAKPGLEPDVRARLEQTLTEAEREAESAKRRAARSRAKADDAARAAAELTGDPEPGKNGSEGDAGG
jgi:amino acid transporter